MAEVLGAILNKSTVLIWLPPMAGEQARSETTKDELLRTAERLFALEGIDAVSTRRISQEAGQRNTSALQYHYGDRVTLLKKLVAARMQPINRRRQALLDELDRRPRAVEVADLVAILVIPFVEQLLDAERGAHYVRIAAQVFAKGEAEAVLGPERPWNQAFYATVERIRDLLPDLPRRVQDRRFRFFAGHLVQVTAAAEVDFRGLSGRARKGRVQSLADELVDYSTGALTAARFGRASARVARAVRERP
jgi:AcrR family transcriptional regulator